MATNLVEVVGEDTSLVMFATNVTGVDTVEFESGAFTGSPEEIRKAVLFLNIGAKDLKLTLVWRDPAFNVSTITGTPLASGTLQ